MGCSSREPWWRNIFENPVTAQFDHRMMAYLILVVALRPCASGCAGRRAARGGAWRWPSYSLAQAVVGIAAVVLEMPLHVALLASVRRVRWRCGSPSFTFAT